MMTKVRPGLRQLDKPTTFYRIVERYEKGIRTLFHGTNKSRHLEYNTWLKANTKQVKDGTNGHVYTAGWHLLPTKKDAEDFKKKQFRKRLDKLEIVPVQVKGNIWEKAHSRYNVYLSEWILIKE